MDPRCGAEEAMLSTGTAQVVPDTVDNVERWFGMVVPKRWSRRAVTRSLIKRQMREAVARHLANLAPGYWIIRQRSAFEGKERWVSAASAPLKLAARLELDELLESARALHCAAETPT